MNHCNHCHQDLADKPCVTDGEVATCSMPMKQPPRNQFGELVVPCGLCGKPTSMTATKRCDGCWELERRIRRDPELARRILDTMP